MSISSQQRESPVEEFLRHRTFAIVGASQSRMKYGNIVFRDLRAKGFTVYPVNPHLETVEGDRCYPSLAALPEKVDGVVFLIPPEQTERVVHEVAQAGIARVWMQPGAESQKAVEFCTENGISVIYHRCIMVDTR